MATSGYIRGSRNETFTPASGRPMTALRVTSAPVPAVVGSATRGRGAASSGRPRPTTSRWSSTGRVAGTSAASALARSITAPPPSATTTSGGSARSAARAASSASSVGSPGQASVCTRAPPASSAAMSQPARPGVAPWTSATLRPKLSTAAAAPSREVPQPNRIWPAVAKVKGVVICRLCPLSILSPGYTLIVAATARFQAA